MILIRIIVPVGVLSLMLTATAPFAESFWFLLQELARILSFLFRDVLGDLFLLEKTTYKPLLMPMASLALSSV